MLRTILLLNPVYVSLFWAIILSVKTVEKNVPRTFLGKILAVGFLLYLSHFIFFSQQTDVYKYFDSIYTLSTLSMHPLYYIYVLLLTKGESFSVKIHGKYLILPLSLFILSVISALTMSPDQKVHYYSFVLMGTARPEAAEILPYIVYLVGRLVFIMQVFVYMFMVNIEISAHNDKIKDYYSDLEERSLGWVKVFNITYFLASIAGIVLALLGREMFLTKDIYLLGPSIVFSVLLFVISYLGYKQKPTSTNLRDSVSNLTELTEPSAERLARELISLFETEKYFLNRDFKILDVSSKLGTNRTYISRVINQEFGINFTTFVNNYRVDFAKHILSENGSITVEELADRSGFGSVNSLYRAFESKENISLTQYRKSNLK